MVRPKKHLGQHFLRDNSISKNIAEGLISITKSERVLEIGPGTGVLTQFLVPEKWEVTAIELDTESVDYLKRKYKPEQLNIVFGDFLKVPVDMLPKPPFSIIGNFPYNISSQIFFRVLEMRNDVPEIVGMLQKEVAERLAAPPGSKTYGILSVLLQAYYNIEYLFTVEPSAFFPPPKVQSGVIRLIRNDVQSLDCNEKLFKTIVKQGFQNRRKTLRNALKSLNLPFTSEAEELLSKRAEQLDVNAFVKLTKIAELGGESGQI